MTAVLPPALAAERFELDTPAGRVSAYRAAPPAGGPAPSLPPLLLVHSVNAAASAAEVAPLFEHYRHQRAVVAVDLPGYGFSDRSDRHYGPRLMTDAVLALVHDLRAWQGAAAVDVLAVSLASEFAARAWCEQAAAIRRLALVSPTGFSGTRAWRGAPGTTRGIPGLYRVVAWKGWSEGIFRNLTRPGVIRYFLRRTWGAQHIDEGLWRYAVATTRQPGAHHAPLHFLSAFLFSADITNLYESLDGPVWVSMATRGDFTDYRGRSVLAARPNWQFHAVEGGALPYFESGNGFFDRLDAFWRAVDPAKMPPPGP